MVILMFEPTLFIISIAALSISVIFVLTGYFFCSRHINRDDLLYKENDFAGPIFTNEKCDNELCSVNAVYTTEDMEKNRIQKDIPKHVKHNYQRQWVQKLPIKRPAIMPSALSKLSDRGRKERVAKYYERMECYLTAVQKETYIKRQAKRAEDLHRRLHRIRHGGISDSRSESKRQDEKTVEENLPVEMQIMRDARRQNRGCQISEAVPNGSSSSSSTDSSLMKVRKKVERSKAMQTAKTPDVQSGKTQDSGVTR